MTMEWNSSPLSDRHFNMPV